MNFVDWILSARSNEITFSDVFLDAWVMSPPLPGAAVTDDFGLYIMGGEL